MNPNLVRLVKTRAAAVLVESKSIQEYGLAFSPNDNLNTIAFLDVGCCSFIAKASAVLFRSGSDAIVHPQRL